MRWLLTILSALTLLSCGSKMPDSTSTARTTLPIGTPDWYDQRHHAAGGGYQNIWGNDRDTPFFKALKWLLSHGFSGGEQVPAPTRLLPPDSLRSAPNSIRLTWLGHASMYVQIGETRILIDPMFSDRASPVGFAGPRRQPPLPLQVEDLPGVDIVLISHDHYDHLDKASITELQRQFAPLFIVPLDVGDIVAEWGAERIRELDWWQWVDVGSLRFTCTPAQHFSGRGVTNRNGTLWSGWYVQDSTASSNLFYAGDTGYATHFTEIRERLGAPDIAILPIGAYLPRWFMQVVHVNPEEALQAFTDLQAGHFVPVHWGTFSLADDPLDEAPRLLNEAAARQGLTERVHVLEIGERLEL